MLHFVQSIIDIGISLGRASPIVTSELPFASISAKKVTKMIRSSGEARAEEFFAIIRENDLLMSDATRERFRRFRRDMLW
jgi:hypothetical protein